MKPLKAHDVLPIWHSIRFVTDEGDQADEFSRWHIAISITNYIQIIWNLFC